MHAGTAEIEFAEHLFGFRDPDKIIRDPSDGKKPAIDFYKHIRNRELGVGGSRGARTILEMMTAGKLRCGILLCPARSGISKIPDYATISAGVSEEWSRLLQVSGTSPRTITEIKELRRGDIPPLDEQIQETMDAATSARLLVIESRGDPWRDTISPHDRITVRTLDGSCHFPHLSTITQDACRTMVYDWLMSVGLREQSPAPSWNSTPSSSTTPPANSQLVLA
jgi:hypothetical protein